MSFIKSTILAFSMFSALPVPRVEWNQKNMRFMMAAFPFVGLVVALLWGGWFLFVQFLAVWQKNLSPALTALGFTLIPVLVTGGIHLDGFMDTSDALGSHASREKKLEILKDSHSGAFAVLACVIYFLCYYVLSYELSVFLFEGGSSHRFENDFTSLMAFLPVLSIFVISRLLSALAVATFPIAKDSGLVHTFASSSDSLFTAVWCLAWLFIVSVFLIITCNYMGIAMVGVSLALFCFYYVMAIFNFGGITGDTAGWFVQLCELLGLLTFVIAQI